MGTGNKYLVTFSATAAFLFFAISAARADVAPFPLVPINDTGTVVAGGVVVAIIAALTILGIRQSREMNKTGKNAAK